MAFLITKKALINPELRQIIDAKDVEIYGEIKNNPNLKNYLLFNNLINAESMPIFINEADEVLLTNKIKIILITMKKSDLQLLKI